MKFGDNLKLLRKKKNISQEQLGEKVGVSRQSVSKWETGEAYPEMNNILILCKIFKCNINDLISSKIDDINSFDEEVKMNVVKFEKEKQKKMKALSKIIEIIAKIGKICTRIGIFAIIIVMIILPFIISSVNVNGNIISFDSKWSKDKIEIITENGESVIKANDEIVERYRSIENVEKVVDIFNNNSRTKIIFVTEFASTTLVIYLILIMFVLSYIESLFKNINEGGTPFTLDNVKLIKRIAYYMIAVIIISGVGSLSFELLLPSMNFSFSSFDLVEILFLFSLAYIFEYGYEIQKDSNGRMYDNE